jgi:hypothetical protein
MNFPLNIAVGDSLLHGRGAPGVQTELELYGRHRAYTYRTEDIEDYMKSVDMLASGTYHVVVGNPPYINVKDKEENARYREAYVSCYREYSLAVPFAERFFQLALRGSSDGRGAGYVGQITANSFMKREFGKKLVEEFFPTIDLTYVIDTSGARLPGFGTPPVTLIGRRRWPRAESTIRVVLRVRSEPGQPKNPALGSVWCAIVDQVEVPGSESEWITVMDLPRSRFATHPWSLAGGGAAEVRDAMEGAGAVLQDKVASIGFGAISGEDDAFFLADRCAADRMGIEFYRDMILGDAVRDYGISGTILTVWPYSSDLKVCEPNEIPNIIEFLWPLRRILQTRRRFGVMVETIASIRWYEYRELYREKLGLSPAIAFAEIKTHNNFALSHQGGVFNRSAPVIKLPEGATVDDHQALLGVLNSSAACFLLKQVCQPKGGSGIGRGVQDEPWEERFVFTVTRLEQFPLPAELPLKFGREMDGLAQRLAAVEPSAVCADGVPTRGRLDVTQAEHGRIRRRMIALQEELDWNVYWQYGLLDGTEAPELMAKPESIPELKLGDRAFEIALARRLKSGEQETQWFARHGSTPITEIPAHWPQDYRDVVAKRIETIERRRDIALIERPECKRRWQSEPWEKKERAALRNWLLERCEGRGLWYATDHQGNQQPRSMTVNRLADRLRGDADVVSVARLFSGSDADLADVLKEIIADEHVPFLAKLRYSGTGLLKRLLWEKTWDQQREEDRTSQRLEIEVPPKYKPADFIKTSYWSQRGKLDVPKERFISYPGASPDSDDSLLLGWAGWDQREKAYALITLIEERATTDGWNVAKLTPLLAGLLEVMPWVRQWHNKIDDNFRASPAQEYDAYLTSQREKYGLTEEDLHAWTPPVVRRQRRGGGGA